MTEVSERVGTLHQTRVPKEKLLKTLGENRDKHKTEFGEALDGYYDALGNEIADLLDRTIASMERNIKRAKEHAPDTRTTWPAVSVLSQRPSDHTDDFDRAIARLEWDTAEMVDLSMAEFDRFVLNKWVWMQEHRTSISSFAAHLND